MRPRAVAMASAVAVAWLVFAVALLVLRSAGGPWIPVQYPMTMQNWVIIALFCLGCAQTLARAPAAVETAPSTVPQASLAWAGAIAIATMAPFLWCLHSPFLSDDYYLVALSNGIFPGDPIGLLIHAGSREFFRPVGGVSFALTAAYGHVNPVAWHLTSMALHATNCILAYLLALRLLSDQASAGLTAILFGWNGTRPEAVVWAAPRFDLLSALFLFAALLCAFRYLNARRHVPLAGMLLFGALAMATKESAFVFPLLVFLLGVQSGMRAAPAAKFAAPAFLTAALLFVVRFTVLGGIGGYTSRQTGQSEILAVSPVSAAKALFLRIWEVLAFPINWSRPPGIAVTVLLPLMVAALAWALFRTPRVLSRVLWFGLAFVIVSAVPAIAQLLIGVTLEKSRELYFPAFGFCLLTASLLRGRSKRAFRLGAAAVAAFQLAALAHNLIIWRDVASLAGRTCTQVAAAAQPPARTVEVDDLPGLLDGVYFLRNGLQACAVLAGAPASTEIRESSGGEASPATVYLRWDPVLRLLVREPPTAPR